MATHLKILWVGLGMLALAGCEGGGAGHSAGSQSTVMLASENSELKLTPGGPLSLNVADTLQLQISSPNKTDAGGDLVWHNNNPAVLSIDSKGVITALAAGTATLSASSGNLKSTPIEVTVQPTLTPTPSALGASLAQTELRIGESAQAQVISIFSDATSEPANHVSWISSNDQIASISPNGTITARSLGLVRFIAVQSGLSSNALELTVKPATNNVQIAAASTPDIVVHFLKPKTWKAATKIHWWQQDSNSVQGGTKTSFPGVNMTSTSNDGWLEMAIPGFTQVNVLFNDGGAASAGFHQTTDQLNRKGGWFVPNSKPDADGKYSGKWFNTKPQQELVCDVKHFGAKGNGSTKDTAAIQAAINACAGKNGIVSLHDGKFVSGTIVLKSDMTFRVAPSATLLGTRDTADYPTQFPNSDNSQLNNCRKALIYAEKAKNLRIDGGGTIDGNGGNGSPWINGSIPEAKRPMAIFIVQSDGVTIENVNVKNAAMWTIVPFESDNVVIRGVNVQSLEGATRDGIDIVDGHHVLIENVTVATEDDAICLKSGTSRGVIDVLVRNSKITRSIVANGLKFGTATTGPFKDITFENISIENVTRGAMAVESVDGSNVSNIIFRNITTKNVGTPFYLVLGDRSSKRLTATPRVGSIDNITFENITGTTTAKTWGSYMSGILIAGQVHKLNHLTFKNIDLTFKGGSNNVGVPAEYNGEYPDPGPSKNLPNQKDMPGYLYFRHIDNLTLSNVKIKVSPNDKRPLIVTEDVSHLIRN